MCSISKPAQREPKPSHPELKLAVEYISRHLATRFHLQDLATAAGVSTRTLGYLFLRNYGVTPMAFVKQERLKKAQRLLERADPVTATVAGVARCCGFTHMGQFAIDYRRLIGESPSETLHRT